MRSLVLTAVVLCSACPYTPAQGPFTEFEKAFTAGYTALEVEAFTLDMRERLRAVPSIAKSAILGGSSSMT